MIALSADCRCLMSFLLQDGNPLKLMRRELWAGQYLVCALLSTYEGTVCDHGSIVLDASCMLHGTCECLSSSTCECLSSSMTP